MPPYLGTATAAAVVTEVLNLFDDAMRTDENIVNSVWGWCHSQMRENKHGATVK